MCKSQADGGQRCAAHTRRVFERVRMYDTKWDDAAAQYASTAEGRDVLVGEAEKYAAAGDFEREARCKAALVKGADIRDANADAAAEIARRDLTRWTPADVDTELARLYGEAAKAQAEVDGAWSTAVSVANRLARRSSWDRQPLPAQMRAELDAIVAKHDTDPDQHTETVVKALRDHADLLANRDAIIEARAPYEKEFERRGGWNRAFLVSGTTGHVHRSMACSSCHTTTQFHWVTEMSNHTEEEIVEAAGERACTLCYPSAPVETLNRPTTLFTPEERTQQEARGQRATAAAEKQAKKIANALTPDGSEFRVECTRYGYPQRERFKTESTATSWMVSNIANFRSPHDDRPMDESMLAEHERIIEAIAGKHDKPVEQVRADIEKKVVAKIKRDSR